MAMDEGDLSVWMAKLVNTTGIDSDPQPPVETTLVMKAPVTPTSRQTRIAFTTYHDSSVQLSIHDIRGRLIRSLVSEQRTAGQYSEMWNGNDRSGRSVASGVYLIRLQAGQDLVTRKVVITK
jgi:flagellar hook assembly protein FlgD